MDKKLTQDQILEMMNKFMSRLDDKSEELDNKLDKLESLMANFNKRQEESEPEKGAKSSQLEDTFNLEINIGRNNRTSQNPLRTTIEEEEAMQIQLAIKGFVREIMSHPQIESLEIVAEQNDLEK